MTFMKELEALSEREGRPIVETLRNAIRAYIGRHPLDLSQKPLGRVSDGSRDESDDEEHLSDR
jgi:predicted DNA-binding protein